MPRPKGWTAEEEAARDRCVQRILEKRTLPPAKTQAQRTASREQRAYMICTAQIHRSRKLRREKGA